MRLADPLSRLCAPGDGFCDVSLPGKISTLFLQNMPQQVAERNAMRVSANKDAVARMVQKWRKPSARVNSARTKNGSNAWMRIMKN